MEQFIIQGGNPLSGTLKIGTSKNATLPILAGSILSKEGAVVCNVPNFTDIHVMVKILKGFGFQILKRGHNLHIHTKKLTSIVADQKYTKQVRSSIFLLGPMLARFKEVKMAYPGGCKIGARPIDIHLEGLKELGVEIIEEGNYIHCLGYHMKASDVTLRFPSVGATENLMMASVFLKGKTILRNVAKEPEIVDLANFLKEMGAKIVGAGTDTIEITGVKALKKVRYTPIPDRIITGTFLLACASCGGRVTLTNCVPQHNQSLIAKLVESGCQIECNYDTMTIESSKRKKTISAVVTGVYPEFPTDLQSIYLAFATKCKRKTKVEEKVFESRFGIIPNLNAMGAKITINDRCATIYPQKLKGAIVEATDLRAGAGLVIAGLMAKGQTIVTNIYHIDRGYDHIEKDLSALGANIKRIK